MTSYLLRLIISLIVLFASVYPLISDIVLSDGLIQGWVICLIFLPFCLYDIIKNKD